MRLTDIFIPTIVAQMEQQMGSVQEGNGRKKFLVVASVEDGHRQDDFIIESGNNAEMAVIQYSEGDIVIQNTIELLSPGEVSVANRIAQIQKDARDSGELGSALSVDDPDNEVSGDSIDTIINWTLTHNDRYEFDRAYRSKSLG